MKKDAYRIVRRNSQIVSVVLTVGQLLGEDLE